ncbi:MAG: hypothetical protein IPO37_10595 [Saprospiraceae bacterium]|nr:hypothetical protein [Saprospiraceae bacterium]
MLCGITKSTDFQDEALLQKCITTIKDLKAWDLESRIHEILNKLKITDFNQRAGEMSGDQEKDLHWRILIEEPDFLISTNQPTTEWI